MFLLALLASSVSAATPVSAKEAAAFQEERVAESVEDGAARYPIRLPYNPCWIIGMVWDGHRCVPSPDFPTNDDPFVWFRQSSNEAAFDHNAVLANDFAVRGDTEITTEDAPEFFGEAGQLLCNYGEDCDPEAFSQDLLKQYDPLLADGYDPAGDLVQILRWDIENGTLSERLGNELIELVNDADSGKYTGEELQSRVDNELVREEWKGSDLDAVLTFQTVSHASYEYWGGTAASKAGPGSIFDGLTTLGCGLLALSYGQVELLPHAAAFGAWGSSMYNSFFGRGYAPSTLRWDAITTPTSFQESVLINDSVYTVQGTLSQKGGEVQLVDAKGNQVSARAISTSEKLIDPSTLDSTIDKTEAAARDGHKWIFVPIYTPWGWYILAIEVQYEFIKI